MVMTVYHQCIMKLPNHVKIINQAILLLVMEKKRVGLHNKCCIWRKNIWMQLRLVYCLEIF